MKASPSAVTRRREERLSVICVTCSARREDDHRHRLGTGSLSRHRNTCNMVRQWDTKFLLMLDTLDPCYWDTDGTGG